MPGSSGDGRVPYAGALAYNGTGAEGANPLEFDVNLWYQVSLSYPFVPLHCPSILENISPRDTFTRALAFHRGAVGGAVMRNLQTPAEHA